MWQLKLPIVDLLLKYQSSFGSETAYHNAAQPQTHRVAPCYSPCEFVLKWKLLLRNGHPKPAEEKTLTVYLWSNSIHYRYMHIPLCLSLTFLTPKAQTQWSQNKLSRFYTIQFPMLFFNLSSPPWPLLFTSSLLHFHPALYPSRAWTQTRRETNYRPWDTHTHAHTLSLFLCVALAYL